MGFALSIIHPNLSLLVWGILLVLFFGWAGLSSFHLMILSYLFCTLSGRRWMDGERARWIPEPSSVESHTVSRVSSNHRIELCQPEE